MISTFYKMKIRKLYYAGYRDITNCLVRGYFVFFVYGALVW